jgi:hypothetical protein
VIHFDNKLVDRGILCGQANKTNIELHSLLKILRTLYPRLGVNEVAHRNAPGRFEDVLNSGEKSGRQAIERIGVLSPCTEKLLENESLLSGYGHTLPKHRIKPTYPVTNREQSSGKCCIPSKCRLKLCGRR